MTIVPVFKRSLSWWMKLQLHLYTLVCQEDFPLLLDDPLVCWCYPYSCLHCRKRITFIWQHHRLYWIPPPTNIGGTSPTRIPSGDSTSLLRLWRLSGKYRSMLAYSLYQSWHHKRPSHLCHVATIYILLPARITRTLTERIQHNPLGEKRLAFLWQITSDILLNLL